MNTERIKTPCAELFWHKKEPSIVRIEYFTRDYDLQDAQRHIELLIKHFYTPKQRPLLVLSSTIGEGEARKSIRKDIREYFASKEVTQYIQAAAVISKNSVTHLVGQLFVNVNKPTYPIQLFGDEDTAIEWLKSNR